MAEFTESGSTSSLSKFFSFGSAKKAAITKAAQKALPKLTAKTPPGSEAPLAKAWKQSTIRLKYLDNCVQNQNCEAFSQAEPSSYYLETRMAQAQELRDFTAIAVAWKEQYGGQALPAEAKQIAEHFLKTGDDYVKDEALDLADLCEPDRNQRDALVEALMKTGDGSIMEKAMNGVLKKYKGDALVDRMLIHQAAVGSTKVQAAIAKNAMTMLTAENHSLFEVVSTRFEPRSPTASYWRANLAESRRMQEGG
jgi:hypothetical protein